MNLPHSNVFAFFIGLAGAASLVLGCVEANEPCPDCQAEGSSAVKLNPCSNGRTARNCKDGAVPDGSTGTGSDAGPGTTDSGSNAPDAAANDAGGDGAVAATSGWPDATNTGAKGTLTLHQGDLTVTVNGTVLENLEVRGRLTVGADNVRLKNVRVVSTDYWVLLVQGSNTVIEDSTLIGTANGQASLAGGSWIGRRLDISGAGDGIKMGANSKLYDSYIHDLSNDPTAHNDGVEITNAPGAELVHNSILNEKGQTSAVMISEFGSNPSTGVIIDGNLLGGGGYTLYGGAPDTARGHKVTNNFFTTRFFPSSGYYGAVSFWSSSGNTWSGNVWADGPQKGQALTP